MYETRKPDVGVFLSRLVCAQLEDNRLAFVVRTVCILFNALDVKTPINHENGRNYLHIMRKVVDIRAKLGFGTSTGLVDG